MDIKNMMSAIASDSPMSSEQFAWIGGYFAGMQDAMASMAPMGKNPQDPLFVLYGSQTGNAEAFAQELAEATNGECLDMADVEKSDFAQYKHMVIVTSTYGDGEHPDNGQIFWDSVQDISKMACNYAIIGLGDTAYDLFCKSAEDWDQYLDGRGAKRLLDTVKLDVDFADYQADIIAKTKSAFEAVRGVVETNVGLDVAVLFGSQTGNAEAFARDLADTLDGDAYDMADIDVSDFTEYGNIAIVTSTYGDGEHPDNGQILWDSVQDIDNTTCNFAVIGLGDTAYDLFCKSAYDWEQFLTAKGGNKILDTVALDVDFADYQDDIIAKTKSAFEKSAGISGGGTKKKKPAPAHKSMYTRANPYQGAFLTHTLLSSPKSSKRVYHFEFEVDDPEMAYETGDAVGVVPINSDSLVQNILSAGGFDGTKDINGKSFADILKYDREIRLPNRDFISAVAHNANDSDLISLLADKPAMDDWLWGRETVDILQQFNHGLDEESFLNTLKPLQHRLYSISSSPKVHPGEVHLTVGAVEYDFNDRACQGVASCFMAERLAIGDTVGLFMHTNKAFSIPENGDSPIIMVGPGTGIAPFRAFLEERIATHASGANWLFFGDRTKANDFLYQDTLTQWESEGKVRLSLAWSRDPNCKKTYVQDVMKQHGEDIFNQFEKGAYFYICGDASRMAKDVEATLLEIVSTHGAMSIEKATAYINELKKNKRYVRDVY